MAAAALWLAALLLVACGGCWEEIHYEPSVKPAASSEPATSPAGQSEVTEASPRTLVESPQGTEPPPAGGTESISEASPERLAAAHSPPAATPSPDDLFSGQLPTSDPSPDAVAAATDESAESPEPAGPAAEQAQTAAESVLPTPDTSELQAGATTATSDPAVAEPSSPADRRLAWQAASKWSLAAAIYAKGLPGERYQPILTEADAAASDLGIELPLLPSAARREDLEASVIEALRGESAVTIANRFSAALGPAEAAAADLAIRSHLLLLTYSPRSGDAPLHAAALRQAAERSELRPETWQPLVELIERKAPFAEVRQAVFDLHRRADAELAEQAG
jgi:hypothetical protein